MMMALPWAKLLTASISAHFRQVCERTSRLVEQQHGPISFAEIKIRNYSRTPRSLI